MNSSMMLGGMNASLYMDSSGGGGSFLNKSRALPAVPTSGRAKFIRFTNSNQSGRNVSKVRWLVEDSFFSVPDPFATEYFISGSWSWVEEENDICLWRLEVGPSAKEGEKDSKVTLINKASIPGSISDLSVLRNGRFCACTSQGGLYTFKCNNDTEDNYTSLEEVQRRQLFTQRDKNSPATAVATKDEVIVAVGENGSIFECSSTLEVVRSFEKADPLSISSVCFIGRNEILTGNGGGQLKLWDLRSGGNEASQIFNPNVLMNNLYGVSSISQHPTQTHAIIVGYQSGCMDLWDLRMGPDCDPVANLASEGGSVSELYFHQINPDHFFSCSQSGQVCHWYPAERLSNPLQVPLEYTTDLNIEFLKKGLVYKEIQTSPFPINSLNVSRNDRLVIGSDSGVVLCTEVRV